jgi:hypothetical protein
MVRYLVGTRAVRVWQSLAPFIAKERESNPSGVGFRFFEDLATRCAELSAAAAAKQFRLREFPVPAGGGAVPQTGSSPLAARGGEEPG